MRIEEICEGNFIKKVNITIAAAGTGGHINPGIAIADNLQMMDIIFHGLEPQREWKIS